MTDAESMEQKKKIIIVPRGGLANRMRALASAFVLASDLGREPVAVWHKDRLLNARFSDIFKTEDLPFTLIEPGDAEFNLFYEAPRKKNLYISSLTACVARRKIMNLDYAVEDDVFKEFIRNLDKDVIINSGLEFAGFSHDLLNALFRPKDSILQLKNEILGNHCPQVSVQIRRTDNKESIENSPVRLFEEKIVSEIEKNKDVFIFAATDCQETKDRLKSHFPHNIIVNPREARRNTLGGIEDAAAEMYIMAGCQRIYGSYYSSFSEMASRIGDNELIVLKSI